MIYFQGVHIGFDKNIFENEVASIFSSPFFPKELNFSDVTGIVSVLLSLISIALAIIIFRLSNKTSERLAEEAARRAFEKSYGSSSNSINNSTSIQLLETFSKDQRKTIKKLINQLLKRANKNSSTSPWVYAASIPIQLKNTLNEEQSVRLMYMWKEKKYITWENSLESSTKVYILKGDLLIEDINSC